MAHALEIIDGVANFAWTGEPAWHGLGQKLPVTATPHQMRRAAKLNWRVEKADLFTTYRGRKIRIEGQKALVRSSDRKVLSVVGDEHWHPVQNEDGFEVFTDFVKKGHMKMSAAGSLHGGKLVWVLAKTQDSFKILKKDLLETYVMLYIPHQYGKAVGMMATPTRVVCKNTFNIALQEGSELHVRYSHRELFSPAEVKDTLEQARQAVNVYKEQAEFIASKRYTDQKLLSFYRKVFPALGEKAENKELSLAATKAYSMLEVQPGANLGEGTWWQAFNSVTFCVDHFLGQNDNNRLGSAWFGRGQKQKTLALEQAVAYAKAA